MPFPLISTVLVVCFLLVWAFIGGMVFREGQLTIQRERETDENVLRLDACRITLPPSMGRRQMNRQGKAAVRAAS